MIVALCALTLAGCSGAYQACINSNLKNAEACEDKRVQMETIERAYRNR